MISASDNDLVGGGCCSHEEVINYYTKNKPFEENKPVSHTDLNLFEMQKHNTTFS